jgi:hypothetical protein
LQWCIIKIKFFRRTTVFCRHCGKKIEDDSTFCRFCGGSVAVSTTDSAPANKGTKTSAAVTGVTDARPKSDDGEPEFREIPPEHYRRVKLSPEARAREAELKKIKQEKEKTNQMLRRVVLNQLLKEPDPGTKAPAKKEAPKKPVDTRTSIYQQAMNIKKSDKSK